MQFLERAMQACMIEQWHVNEQSYRGNNSGKFKDLFLFIKKKENTGAAKDTADMFKTADVISLFRAETEDVRYISKWAMQQSNIWHW